MANRACAEIDRRATRNLRARQVYPNHSDPVSPQSYSPCEHGSNGGRVAALVAKSRRERRSYSPGRTVERGQGIIRLARPNPRCSLSLEACSCF